ncbi:hypothetical protein JTB14_023282 [Gonioctena quinquepunctata]|nr:hypothetical protein JTB14_023282 [Gonioctena quinquepunctata]
MIGGVSSDKSALMRTLNIFNNFQHIIIPYELDREEIKELLKDDTKYFDVLLLQTSNIFPSVYGFGAKFPAPIVGISSMDLYLHTHDAAGNPTHPLVSPDIMLNFHGQLNFFDKVWSVLHNILYRMFYYWYALPIADKVARKYFGEDMPYLGDIEKNISLILTTVNPIIHPVRPNVPNVIEINQIHIREKRPLPKVNTDKFTSCIL